MNDPELVRLAELLQQKDAIEREIAALIGRPAFIGHVGEFIASRIFGIKLAASASRKTDDGVFTTGPLAGRSVNVKWYTRQEYILDVSTESQPDFYLVMVGRRIVEESSINRPWVIVRVHLFNGPELANTLQSVGVKLGVSTSVRQAFWDEAEIYPEGHNERLRLTAKQRALLRLFG